MAYRLTDPVGVIKGVGDKLTSTLAEAGIKTVLDLVLYLPFRYQDSSHISQIEDLLVGEESTIKATVVSKNISYRGRRVTVRATVEDDTGRLNCIWFNNRFIHSQLTKGQPYFLAGKYSDRKMLVQPIAEKISDDPTHTARLVPIYSSKIGDLKLGTLRRILKEATNNLKAIDDPTLKVIKADYPNFIEAIKTLHFPDAEAAVPAARERLALEELMALIKHSQATKKAWQTNNIAFAIELENYDPANFASWLPKSIPFKLTGAQQRATKEILADISNQVAMNRILIGDVGSGKTVVAGIAADFVLKNQHHALIIAPTQILAQQHLQSLRQLFPKLPLELLTTKESKNFKPASKATFYIGTHAALNHLTTIEPALIIYDEQHRFGVKQRTTAKFDFGTPHILTMSATPIPRSLMLTLFAHLSVSQLDELPQGRKPTKTWLVPKSKKEASLAWLAETIKETKGQALVVCPFIEPSSHESFSNVTAATELFKELTNYYQKTNLKLGLLHGKLKNTTKQKIIRELYEKKIDLLVTTPVVEVGVDLPAANIMMVEAAERFGLASLHQLRGRVGRAGQESYCLLVNNSPNKVTNQRLKDFSQEHDGLKLAEQDLKNRGAGDLFGFRQHGLSDLKFASWADLKLIQTAHLAFQELNQDEWQPLITYQTSTNDIIPHAN